MHFGKIVKNVAYSAGLSADNLALKLGVNEVILLNLYEQKDWTSGNIKAVSVALEHDFEKYFATGFQFNFLPDSELTPMREFTITISYPIGKEFLLKTWLDKMVLIAKAIGLNVNK
ncbi:hypothetical protein [Daejeonella oryzae]|uniref:hypothetical protein n=1 Tax=Daejeonella oryzae TaxID=1122943 RepID=UPI000419D2A1|nr:hypothetical protein [Daejeonella oryzae]